MTDLEKLEMTKYVRAALQKIHEFHKGFHADCARAHADHADEVEGGGGGMEKVHAEFHRAMAEHHTDAANFHDKCFKALADGVSDRPAKAFGVFADDDDETDRLDKAMRRVPVPTDVHSIVDTPKNRLVTRAGRPTEDDAESGELPAHLRKLVGVE